MIGDGPPRATLVGWLKLNLALTMAIVSICSACAGALVTATWRVAMTERTLDDLVAAVKRDDDQIASLHHDMVDVDRRFNESGEHFNDVRRQMDGDHGALQARVGVLEAQLRFFVERIPPAKIGSR